MANIVNRQTKEIQEEKVWFEVILQNIAEGVIVTDTQGRIVMLNKAAELLTGWKEEEAINRPTAEVFHVIDEYTRQRCENPIEKVLNSKLSVGLINHRVLIDRTGIERIIVDASAPIYGEDGRVTGAVLIFRDITEQRRYEEKFREAERLSGIVEIVSESAHEIKNPLTVIKSGLHYLQEILRDNEEAQEIISKMDYAVQKAVNYIDDLLDFSKPFKLKVSRVNINKVIKNALNEIPGEILLNIEIHQKLSSDLPDILADVDRLNQVIINLIKNAAEAMDGKGKLEIKTEKLKINEKEVVQISISDTGKGIAKEYFNRIFKPFFTTKPQGTGLGLTICQRIIEAHKGEIEVKSELGKGTIFTVRLPKVMT